MSGYTWAKPAAAGIAGITGGLRECQVDTRGVQCSLQGIRLVCPGSFRPGEPDIQLVRSTAVPATETLMNFHARGQVAAAQTL